MSQPYTIGGINLLPDEKKRKIYGDLIPDDVLMRFGSAGLLPTPRDAP